MNYRCLTTLVAAGAVLSLLPCAAPAVAGPPVPEPPPYRVPQWPVPVPGQWQAAPAPRHEAGRAATLAAEINRRRTQAGCHRVRLRAALTRAAQAHSTDMARSRRLDHTATDGSSPEERMRAAGYPVAYSGEVLAAGAVTAGAAVRVWMNSPPHRDIILSCRYTDAGIGVADGPGGPWWTLDLATRR